MVFFGKATFFLFLFFIASLLACSDDELYIIRTLGPNGLVLDAIDPETITIQHFNGFASQLWRFERGDRPGLFYIRNEATKNVVYFKNIRGTSYLTTTPLRHILGHQWTLGIDGCITNAQKYYNTTYNFDISYGTYTPGNSVKFSVANGATHQKFVLQKKN